MTCKEIQRVLSRHLDHELSSAETAGVEEHLARCAECRTEYLIQQRLWTLIGRAEPIRSPDFVTAVEARLSERRGWMSFRAGLGIRSLGYAAAIASLVVLFIWAGVWAGAAQYGSGVGERDRTFTELLSDAPPGMEVVAVLDQIGERP